MSITLTETFTVAAGIDDVWQFILSPENIARCMPGATLNEIIDERRFNGQVKVKIGAITARYTGTITYTDADRDTGRIVMLAEAADKGGATVKGTITTELLAVSTEQTQVQCSSAIDMTGRIVQLSRGMIEGVAGEIIGLFIANVKRDLEPATQMGPERVPEPPPVEPMPNMLRIILKVLHDLLGQRLRRLLRLQHDSTVRS